MVANTIHWKCSITQVPTSSPSSPSLLCFSVTSSSSPPLPLDLPGIGCLERRQLATFSRQWEISTAFRLEALFKTPRRCSVTASYKMDWMQCVQFSIASVGFTSKALLL